MPKGPSRPPLPPFDAPNAAIKVRLAEDAWNSRDPARVALAYTADSHWRNRSEFIVGRVQIVAFLTRKWAKERDYRLIKELWSFADDRIAVRFAYEWQDAVANWFRSYVIDAGMASLHQPVARELPVLIAVGAKPVGDGVLPLVGEAHRDAIVCKTP